MNFNFTDEQTALRDQLLRFMQKTYSFDQRREFMRSPQGWSREVWQQFADMGLLGLNVPEAHGGLGGSAADNAVNTLALMEIFGRGLVVEPYVSTVVLGATLLAQAGTAAQQAALLPKIASGETLLALAHQEPTSRYALAQVETTATPEGGGYVIHGAKSVVLHGDSADHWVVSARTAGSARDEHGISLFLIPRGAGGVTLHGYPTQDGQRAADLSFDQVQVAADRLIGARDQGLAPVERAIETRHRGAVRRGRRRDVRAAGNHRRLFENAQAIRRRHRQFSGAATPHGRHADAARSRALHGLSRRRERR